MKTKKVLGCALALALLASLTTPIQAAENGWKMSGGGVWNYTNVDGTLAKGWQTIDGCWYAFETDGSMKTGWIASDEKWYFMGESGIMQDTGWVNYEGADYYLKGTGVMATDYFKEGYELDSTGKAIPMTQTKSVELTEHMDINNKTIEGNLYIDATKFKELELSGITVTGKIVIIGNDIKDSKITIKDSTVNTISSQTRGAEITLAGTTTVKSIQIEENSAIKPAEDYTGKVESIEIQSTAQKEVKIEVPAQSVTSNTFAPVTVEAKVDNLAVNKKTELTVNDDIKSIIVNHTATDTKVEVEKGSTVGSIESNTKVEISGKGKVEHIKGEEITNDTKPPRPSGEDRPSVPTGVPVATEAEFLEAMENNTDTKIVLLNDITVDMTRFSSCKDSTEFKGTWNVELEHSKIIDLNRKTLTLLKKVLIRFTKDGTDIQFRNGNIIAREFNNKSTKSLFSTVGENITFTLDNVTLDTTSAGILPDGINNVLNIKHSTINSGIYAVNTNASSPKYLTVNIDNSHLTTTNANDTQNKNVDNSTILFNIPGSLNISNSTLTGDRHGLIIRGGTAEISNTSITYKGGYAKPEHHYTTIWEGGNELPSAPVVIGNVDATSYLYRSDVTFTNVIIEGAVKELTGDLASINGTQIVVAANTVYTDDKNVDVSFTSDKLYKIHVIEKGDKKPIINLDEPLKN